MACKQIHRGHSQSFFFLFFSNFTVALAPVNREEKIYTTTVETLLFSFSGSEALWCIPFFPDLWCIPFSLSFLCSVTSGSGDRPRKERGHGGGVYSFFPG